MLRTIILKYKKIQDSFFTQQVYYFSKWLEKNIEEERCVYIISTKGLFKKKSLHHKYRYNPPSFFFCEKGYKLSVGLEKIMGNGNGKNSWVKIFSHPRYEIYENTSTLKSTTSPLRFGLLEEEQIYAFMLARSSLLNGIFKKQIEIENIHNRFKEVSNVAVTLWFNGSVYGSQIIYDLPLYNGIIKATKKAYEEGRSFKKIEENDSQDFRIELMILHSLNMPLLYTEITRNSLCHNKVYSAGYGDRNIFCLPNVFNRYYVSSLRDVCQRPFLKKNGIELPSRFIGDIFISEVNSYIETRAHTSSLVLDGPIPQIIFSKIPFYFIRDRFVSNSLMYLERIQELDGTIPVVVNPVAGSVKRDDISRLCCTVYSLFLYDSIIHNNQSKKIAEKSFKYLKGIIYTHSFNSFSHKSGALMYYAKASKLCDNAVEYTKSRDSIETLMGISLYDPILYSQYALLLLEDTDVHYEKVILFVDTILFDFEEKEKMGEEIDLASYVELPRLLCMVAKFSTKENFYREKSKRIITWYMEKQNEDGSFYSSTTNNFSYTRGTAKIIEVLVNLDNINKESIEKAFRWCLNMQYSRENSYYLSKDIQDSIDGGLRHDYFNQEVWIDGIGHLLIALANKRRK